MNRHWIGDGPIGPGASSPFYYAQGLATAVVDGYPCCAVWVTGPRRTTITYLMAAALPPPNAPAPVVGHGLVACWERGGIGAYCLDRLDPSSIWTGAMTAVVAHARAAGAPPLLALDEVDDPGPLDAAREQAELAVAPDPRGDAYVEAHRIQCAVCGAPSSAAELVGHALCPYCGAAQALPPDVLDALRLYQMRVHAGLLRATSSFGAWRAPAATAGHVVIACAHCGASNLHRPGAVDERCGSCRSALIPSRAAIARGIAAVQDATERAHGAAAIHLAHTLHNSRTAAEGSIAGAAILFALSAFFPLVVAVPLALSRHPEKAIAPFFVGFAMSTLVLVVTWLRRRKRRTLLDRWNPRLVALAEQLGAARLGPPRELIAWGARWWNDRISNEWMSGGPAQGAFELRIGGFPMVTSVQLEPFPPVLRNPGATYVAYIVVLLAGRPPRDVAYWLRQGEAARVRRELAAEGFSLEIRTAGLTLVADADGLDRIRRDPDRLARLTPVAFALARLAHLLRLEAPLAAGR